MLNIVTTVIGSRPGADQRVLIGTVTSDTQFGEDYRS